MKLKIEMIVEESEYQHNEKRIVKHIKYLIESLGQYKLEIVGVNKIE